MHGIAILSPKVTKHLKAVALEATRRRSWGSESLLLGIINPAMVCLSC